MPSAICSGVWGVVSRSSPASAELAGTSAAVAAKLYTQMVPGRGSGPVTSCSRSVILVEAQPVITASATKPKMTVVNLMQIAEADGKVRPCLKDIFFMGAFSLLIVLSSTERWQEFRNIERTSGEFDSRKTIKALRARFANP